MLTTLTILALATPALPQSQAQQDEPAPYVLQIEKLDKEIAERAEARLKSLDGVARVKTYVKAGNMEIWARKAKGATRPVLLSTSRMQSELKKLGLTVPSIAEPDWARTKVYVVEAEGGG